MTVAAASASRQAKSWNSSTGAASVMVPDPPRPACSAQWRGLVGQRAQVEDDVGTVLGLLDPGKRHLGAGRPLPRRAQIGIKRLIAPLALLAGQGIRIGEVVQGCDLAPDHAPQRRADLGRAALLEAVTGGAHPGALRPRVDVGMSEPRADTIAFGRSSGGFVGSAFGVHGSSLLFALRRISGRFGAGLAR